MIRIQKVAICCAAALVAASPALSQSRGNQAQIAPTLPSYAAVAEQVVGAPLILDARVRKAERLKGEEAPGLAPSRARFLIEADVLALIRGPGTMPARVTYVVDVPLDARGKAPKLKKQRLLLFARPVQGHPDQIQLTTLDSQHNYLSALDAMVRSITRDALAADAPPAITGVANAFHVPGTLPGEGATQVFLQTSDGDPVSLQILRRPAERPRWSVSLGDIVDDSGGPPAPGTFLWYRLACGLPPALPPGSIESDDPQNARIAQEDYATVLRDLGPCA